MHGTKLGFMRDILSEAKMFLRQNEVNHMEVPCYQEISVKNLYEDAMKDELLVKYLPTKEQLSGRLPERDFFFGLMCTLRNQYMKDIIAGAHKATHCWRGWYEETSDQHLLGMDGWIIEASLSFE